jgi:integrase
VGLLTVKTIEGMKPGDEKSDGGGLRVIRRKSGRVSFILMYRFKRRQIKFTMPRGLTLAEARQEAAKVLVAAERGEDAAASKKEQKRAKRESDAETFAVLAARCFESSELRSAAWQLKLLHRLVFDQLGSMPIASLKRRMILDLMDGIAARNGKQTAENAYAATRKVLNWFEQRDDSFRSPLPRGISYVNKMEQARDRVLDDAELQAAWNTATQRGDVFGALVRFLLLTGARRVEATGMIRDEVDADGVWTCPPARSKTKVAIVRPLSRVALELLAERPEIGTAGFYFTYIGTRPMTPFGLASFHKDSNTSGWHLHDLRRTARSLMSRAGVRPEIGERMLGHVVGSAVQRVYDRHSYIDEMRHAAETLASQIMHIVDPAADNVRQLRG